MKQSEIQANVSPTETLINANMGFAIHFVGATIGRPPKLWLNHKFDIKNRWLSA